jgi:glycosyltransferase involved in cell wall biosynthesis
VDLVRRAKKRGLRVTAETAPHYFTLTDADVPGYDANREVVEDGQTGVCFRPGDPVDLASAIHRLATDPGLTRRMGTGARESVLRRFTWEKTWGTALRTITERIQGF